MASRTISVIALGALVYGGAGCGGSDNCPSSPAPCGGNIVGTWKFSSVCVDESMSSSAASSCGAKVSVGQVKISGTLTFNKDMTYSEDTTGTVQETADEPASCLTGTGVTCEEIGSRFEQDISSDSASASGRCSKAGSGCHCSFSVTQRSTDSGTYAVQGSVLGQNSSDNGDSHSDYCVQGNTLYLQMSAMSMDMGSSTISLHASAVLERQ